MNQEIKKLPDVLGIAKGVKVGTNSAAKGFKVDLEICSSKFTSL